MATAAEHARAAERLLTRVEAAMTVTLATREPRHPYLVRAHTGGRLRAYMVLDAYGWAIVAPVQNARGIAHMATVDRYSPDLPGDSHAEVRAAALHGLVRYAATGSIGEV